MDPTNLDYTVDALIFSVASGDVESAIQIAQEAEEYGLNSPLFGLVLIIHEFKERRLTEVNALLEKYKGDLPDVAYWVFSGWANSKNEISKSRPEFERIGQRAKSIGINHYNQALYFASHSNWKMAASFLNDGGYLLANLNRDILLTQSDILYVSGDRDGAVKLLEKSLGSDSIRQLVIKSRIKEYYSGDDISINEKKFLNIAIAQTLSMLNSGEDNGISLGSIFYLQLANYLSEKNVYTKLTLAPILFELGQYSIAKKLLSSFERDDSSYVESRIQLADGLASMEDVDQAILVLKDLEAEGDSNYFTKVALGDRYREEKYFFKALTQYSSALNSLNGLQPQSSWVTYFFRGICHQELGNWENARSDYLTALKISPEQPEVLNYLGYSLIERKEDLEDALGMIETAIERDPKSGYIVDSLAWGLYKLGRYEEALGPMKKAFELLPFDPIINDHLGDILWENGKKRSAKLYWKRSLSFKPDKEEINKIKKKIENGLD